ncbi:copper chaperone PCu(A)C [Microcella sp.]|uniref:copper chaperone PCu(A)C n=1 Tax=Microcella sp. TaxID=1913979 RepID=UPI003F70285B
MDSTTTSSHRFSLRRAGLATSLAVIAALALSACATSETAADTDAPATAADSIQIVDGWVKAVDDGMTAAFGMIENSSDADITIVAASSTVSPMMELHEVVMSDGAMVMQQKEGGILVAAASMHELAPGNDHIMMMGVSEALLPGDEVMITLEFSDGSTLEHSFTVKEFSGADEEYMGDMGDMGDE